MAQPPSAWTFTNNTRSNILKGDNNWTAGPFKVALFLATSGIGPASTTYGSLTNEVSNGNGYTTGGLSVGLTLSGTSAVTVTFNSVLTWTGSGTGFSAYYAVLYAVTSGDIIAYFLMDSTPQNVVVAAGAPLNIDQTVTPFATLS